MGVTVLVADDYAPVRASVGEVLRQAGYEVLEAVDGAEALQVIASNEVDVILLELDMPICDGYEVPRRLKSPRRLVILLSAFDKSSAADVRARFDPKIFASLRKPITPRALLEAVEAALEGNQPA